MTSFEGRTFAITGAGSGIGRALSKRLASQGARLAISDVDEEGLEETLEQIGSTSNVLVTRVDVADRDAVFGWRDEVLDRFGEVHGIVNNAGVSLRSLVEEMEIDDFKWLMDINFWGVVHGTQAFLPSLKKVDRGHVVNISSVFGMIGVPTQSAYNASKFAVRGFTESLREEMLVEKSNVVVSCVHPGGIKTNIVRNGRIREMANFEDRGDLVENFDRELARTTAEDAAGTIVKGMQAGKARILIGADARLIDVVQRALPVTYQTLVARLYRSKVRERS